MTSPSLDDPMSNYTGSGFDDFLKDEGTLKK
jgi:hypothetical protein